MVKSYFKWFFFKVEFNFFFARLNDKLIANMIAKCRPFVIHLNARGGSKLTSQGFVSISGCRNLQDLNLSECKNLTVIIINIIEQNAYLYNDHFDFKNRP